jgi:hypothetical membrane protein
MNTEARRRGNVALMTENLRAVSPIHARAWVSAAFALGFVAISARLIALFGSFPPHPWAYLLLAVIALVAGALAIALALAGIRRNVGRSRWAVIAVVLGAAPLIEMLVQFTWDYVLVSGIGGAD